MEVNKKKITNWEIGDVFLAQINSETYKKYNGLFLAIYVQDKFLSEKDENIVIRIKLLENKIDENKENQLNKTEYICTKVTWYEERFFPIDASITLKESMERIAKVPVYPNELGMLFEYDYLIVLDEKKQGHFGENFSYIGNFKLIPPSNYYSSYNYENTTFDVEHFMDFNKFIDELLSDYEKYNLRKWECFKLDKAKETRNVWKQSLIGAIMADTIIKNKSIAPSLFYESENVDTLTYVGNDEEK